MLKIINFNYHGLKKYFLFMALQMLRVYMNAEEIKGKKILAWLCVIGGNMVFFYWLNALITETISFTTFSRPLKALRRLEHLEVTAKKD